MCARTGYTAPCAEAGCEGVSTCRDEPCCPDHAFAMYLDDDE